MAPNAELNAFVQTMVHAMVHGMVIDNNCSESATHFADNCRLHHFTMMSAPGSIALFEQIVMMTTMMLITMRALACVPRK